MKAKKVYSALKESKTIHAATTRDGRQFIETAGGWYQIDGMPRMEEDEFLAYLEVPRCDREKWNVTEGEADEILFDNSNEADVPLTPHPVSIICGGRHLTAFISDDGTVIWLDTDVFAPMAVGEWRFTLRGNSLGEPYIAVTEGLYLMAVLRYEMSPEVMPGQTLCDRLRELIGDRDETPDGEAEPNETDEIVGRLHEMYTEDQL